MNIPCEARATSQRTRNDRDHLHSSDEEEEIEGVTPKVHLTRDDYRIIVTWMEDEKHFESVYGSKKMEVGGEPKLTKKQGFQQLADHLHRFTNTPKLPHLSARNMEQRWKNHLTKFKKVLRMKHSQTGLGITIKEMRRGVTIEDKLDQKCACFARMKKLFENKPNVQPNSTLEIGVPPGCSQLLPARPDPVAVADCGGSDDEEHEDATRTSLNGSDDEGSDTPPQHEDDGAGSYNSEDGVHRRGSLHHHLNNDDGEAPTVEQEVDGVVSAVDDGVGEDAPRILHEDADARPNGGCSRSDDEDIFSGLNRIDRRTGVSSGLREYYEDAAAELESSRPGATSLLVSGSTRTTLPQRHTTTAARQTTTKRGKKSKKATSNRTGSKRTATSASSATSEPEETTSTGRQSRPTAQQSRLSISDNFSRAMVIRQRNDKRRLDQYDIEAAERKRAREGEEEHRKKQLALEEKRLQEACAQDKARREHEKEIQYMKMLTVVIKEGKTPAEAKTYFSLLSEMGGSQL